MRKTKMTPLFGTGSIIQEKQSTLKKNINCTNNTRETNKRKHMVLSLLIAIATLIGIVGCPSPPNNTIATPTSLKQELRLDTTNKTLTLLLNKDIKSIKTPDNISVYKNTPASLKDELAKNTRTASIVNGKLVIVLKDELTAGESFYVHLQKDTIVYTDDQSNARSITSSTPIVPTLFVSNVEIDKTNKTFTLSFNTSLSDKDNSKITLDKDKHLLESDQYTISDLVTKGKISTLVITFKTEIKSGIYTVKFQDNAFKVDNTPNIAFEISIETNGPNIKPGTTKIDVKPKTLMAFFNKIITRKNDNKIEVYKNEQPLVLTQDYTVAITNATEIKITLKVANLHEGDRYQVKFTPDAVQSTNGIGNDVITTNDVSVLFPPALASNDLVLTGDTLAITFKKAIAITNQNKIAVYKNGQPLVLSQDYTVAIDDTDATKIKITLTAAPSPNQTYRVKFLADAIQDIANNQPNKVMETNEYDTIGVWKRVAISAGAVGRRGHTTVVFDNKIWVLGGYIYGYKNDVWSSSNGKDWTEVTKAAGWKGRDNHTMVVFDNKIWVLGGYDFDTLAKDDVWSSSDGVTWTEVKTTGAKWTRRSSHTTVVFDDKIWVLGGRGASDVWSSKNGKDWTEVTKAAGWKGLSTNRWGHTTVVFDDKIWVLGGHDNTGRKNDVWSSSNGKDWTEVTKAAGWTGRSSHTTVVFDDKIWVLGGENAGDYKNDVWSSSDGVTWTEVTKAAGWTGRSDHTTVVFDGKIWVLGGFNGRIFKDDVWTYGLP